MRLRSFGLVALAATALVQSCQPACAPPPPAPVATTTTRPATTTTAPRPQHPTSITIRGQGNGHGRGLSAWGAYGMALSGKGYGAILDHYYGGTVRGSTADRDVRVRLVWAEADTAVTVVSTVTKARWHGQATLYGAIRVVRVRPGVYDVYAAPTPTCAASDRAWKLVGDDVAAPVRITTTVDAAGGAAGDVLGACRPDGSVVHYRGALEVAAPDGHHRVVNELRIEHYLRGVLSREVAASWGGAGGGAGMHALRAMAVAARSFAHNQRRDAYAHTCDTSSCQVYGGAAYRAGVTAPTSHPTVRVCETGNLTFECATTDRAIRETAGEVRTWPNGAIITGEYSASHGPYSSGITYPSVDDSASNVPGNTRYTWTATIPAADIARQYGLGTLTGARSEREPGNAARGVWGNRIVLTGTTRSVTLTNLQFRNDFRLPSHGYAVASVNR